MKITLHVLKYELIDWWLSYNTGDCLIEVATWAGLTVYCTGILPVWQR
jgi:hypothetical protein